MRLWCAQRTLQPLRRPGHREAEMLLERLVTGRGVEESEALLDAVGGEAALVHAHRDSPCLQRVVVRGGKPVEIDAADLDQPELDQRVPGLPPVHLVRQPMQDLRDHYV